MVRFACYSLLFLEAVLLLSAEDLVGGEGGKGAKVKEWPATLSIVLFTNRPGVYDIALRMFPSVALVFHLHMTVLIWMLAWPVESGHWDVTGLLGSVSLSKLSLICFPDSLAPFCGRHSCQENRQSDCSVEHRRRAEHCGYR